VQTLPDAMIASPWKLDKALDNHLQEPQPPEPSPGRASPWLLPGISNVLECPWQYGNIITEVKTECPLRWALTPQDASPHVGAQAMLVMKFFDKGSFLTTN